MSAFTGLLNDKVQRPTSTAEVAAALGASTIMVVACDKEGVEGGLANSLNYISLLKGLGVNVTGVILNKVHTSYLSDQIKQTIKQAFENSGVELLGFVPKMDVEGRGMIPEIEIKYEEFGAQAIKAAEENINLGALIQIAKAPALRAVDYEAFMQKFKNLLTNYKLSASQGGKTQSCS
jgi:cobyrinic acid a,c-diamide synthase